jgi:uncharacterized protein (TIGR04255 family)
MSWRPVNTAHAIERVQFVIQFKQMISAKQAAQINASVERLSVETRMAGPTPLQAVRFGFQVMPDGSQKVLNQQSDTPGWQFVRMSSKGVPIEALVFQDNKIIYETTDYRKWDTYRQRLDKVAGEAIGYATNNLDVETVSLEYFDRFLFDGPAELADPRLLLTNIELFVSGDAASGRTMWHVHRGWFEGSEEGDILINQNCEAFDVQPPGSGNLVRTVTLLTKAEARATSFRLETMEWNKVIELLHDFSGKYFRKAVQKPVLRAVGISEELQK